MTKVAGRCVCAKGFVKLAGVGAYRVMIRVMLSMVLAAVCITLPISGTAHVVLPHSPHFGTSPRLSTANLTRIIENYLAQNPPVIGLKLRHPLGARPPGAYSDMVRAGFLRIVAGTPGSEPGPAYDLTAKGRREISSRFLAGEQLRPSDDFIEIPVGHFHYISRSAVLTHYDFEKADQSLGNVLTDAEAESPRVAFKYYFTGNVNVAGLLRIGRAEDWVIDPYAGPRRTLSQVGRVARQTLPLRLCHREWTVRELPPYRRPQCSAA